MSTRRAVEQEPTLTAAEEQALRHAATQAGVNYDLTRQHYLESRKRQSGNLVSSGTSVRFSEQEEREIQDMARRNGMDPVTMRQQYAQARQNQQHGVAAAQAASDSQRFMELASGTITLSESEEWHIRQMARENGLKFEEVKATWLETKQRRQKGGR
jgi:hypothetical protein